MISLHNIIKDNPMNKRVWLLAVIATCSFGGGALCQWLAGDGNRAHAQTSVAPPTQRRAVRIDDSPDVFTYANAFRVNALAEEALIEFGMNLPEASDSPDITKMRFTETHRLAVSPFTAKRLAITLSEAVRKYESQFGPIELDTSKRIKGK